MYCYDEEMFYHRRTHFLLSPTHPPSEPRTQRSKPRVEWFKVVHLFLLRSYINEDTTILTIGRSPPFGSKIR